jgi:hypothetical protein
VLSGGGGVRVWNHNIFDVAEFSMSDLLHSQRRSPPDAVPCRCRSTTGAARPTPAPEGFYERSPPWPALPWLRPRCCCLWARRWRR